LTLRQCSSHRDFVSRAEIEATWSKESNEGKYYLFLKLDDPSFTALIIANLSITSMAMDLRPL